MSKDRKRSKVQGEGDYESARRYQRDVTRFVDEHDTEELAREAEPESEDQALEMQEAERKGRARSKARPRDDTMPPDPRDDE